MLCVNLNVLDHIQCNEARWNFLTFSQWRLHAADCIYRSPTRHKLCILEESMQLEVQADSNVISPNRLVEVATPSGFTQQHCAAATTDVIYIIRQQFFCLLLKLSFYFLKGTFPLHTFVTDFVIQGCIVKLLREFHENLSF